MGSIRLISDISTSLSVCERISKQVGSESFYKITKRIGRNFKRSGRRVGGDSKIIRNQKRCFSSIGRYSERSDDISSGIVGKSLSKDPIEHCLGILRNYDHSALLQVPFWPARSKSAFVAIRALNAELSKISDSVSSGKDLIVKIRFQWWRDAIRSCYLNEHSDQVPQNHPLLTAIRSAIKSHELQRYHFIRLIDAKENHSIQPRFDGLDSLVSYSQSTTYSILSLLYQSLGLPTTPSSDLRTIDHSLSHLSNFMTISTFLQLLPYYYQLRNVSVIPTDLMVCSEEELFRYSSLHHQKDASSIDRVQQTILSLIRLSDSEIEASRDTLVGTHDLNHQSKKFIPNDSNKIISNNMIRIDKSLVPIFLTSTPSKTYLNRLRSVNFDPFDKRLATRDWKLPFRLLYDAKFCKL
ncbi:Squalene/phytoene synthase-domain-containing protein [Phakopsora pachyrhizi]|uniref:Squalene/phytoene synthase-domain-containing protein n=1 Tax=Phakopsora pachyrhizi TaxID=170000 RepID=A0AAV0AHV3_PHAPC|nr:Squalene/phytoene synthase-domain-containing protein [Phakopsora pachyrhizi]